ncbi:MAG: serine hydrolase domain-containing protein [Bacteroidia bacterium]
MKKLAIALLLLFASPVNGQDLLDLIRKLRTENQIPALGFAVVSPYSLNTSAIDGLASLADSNAIGLHSRFHLGSNSKAVTALMAFEMVKRGKIKWDTKIIEVFPELKAEIHKKYRKTTLADLLRHQSGLAPYTDGVSAMPWYHCTAGNSECRLMFSKTVLREKPQKLGKRQKMLYSNAGYVVVSAMLEKVGELSFENLLELYVNQTYSTNFKIGWPLQVDSTGARGHLGSLDSLYPAPEQVYKLGPVYAAPANMNGSIFDQAFLLQGLLQALSNEAGHMSRDEALNILFHKDGYALGWLNYGTDIPHRAAHDGSTGTFYCRWIIDDKYQRAFVINANAAHPEVLKAVNALEKEFTLRYLSK